MDREMLKILFVSPKAVPFAKPRGLTDVAGALPSALKHLGMHVLLALPHYRIVRKDNFKTSPVIEHLQVPVVTLTPTDSVR